MESSSVQYRARTVVRLLEILDSITWGEDVPIFAALHDRIQSSLSDFYPLTGEDDEEHDAEQNAAVRASYGL